MLLLADSRKTVVIWDEPRLHVNMLRRGRREHAISEQNLRRRFTPTQLTESQLRAQLTRTSVIAAIQLRDSGRLVLSAQAASSFCTRTVRPCAVCKNRNQVQK